MHMGSIAGFADVHVVVLLDFVLFIYLLFFPFRYYIVCPRFTTSLYPFGTFKRFSYILFLEINRYESFPAYLKNLNILK